MGAEMGAGMSRQRSHDAYQRAVQLMPGGVNSAARAFGAVGGEPIFFERGEGQWLVDIDGNRYLDYVGSWGPMILGHQFEPVKEAVHAAVERGTSFGAPTLAENELAELIIESVPSVDMVRLVNSGTEATMSALRVARGYTGRDKVVKFAGNYHGHADCLLVAAGSAGATLGAPNSPGVPEGTARDTLVLEYNDVEQLEQVFSEQGDSIAAVIMEPVCGNMGCVVPTEPFLNAARRLTREYGAVLIFDEVMTGFRVALGGAQQRFGITPDMTTLGKIVGGGLPLGAFGGRRDIMQHVLPAGKVYQAGTLSGNPIATAAGIAMLKALRDSSPYERLEALTARLEAGWRDVATELDVPHCINRVGSMMTMFFQPGPVVSWTSSARSDTERFARFFWGMIEHGVYLPCSQFEALFVSACHTEQDIDATIQAARTVLSSLATA